MLENFFPSLRLSRDSLEELATRVRRAKYHPTEEELRIFSRYYAGMPAFLVRYDRAFCRELSVSSWL